MPAQNLPRARHAFSRLPITANPASPDKKSKAEARETERIRAELIVAKVTPHVSPQALMAAILKHVNAAESESASQTR